MQPILQRVAAYSHHYVNTHTHNTTQHTEVVKKPKPPRPMPGPCDYNVEQGRRANTHRSPAYSMARVLPDRLKLR